MSFQNTSMRWYERHSWILLFALGLLLVVSALFRLFVLRGNPETLITVAVAGMTWAQILGASPAGTDVIYGLASRAWGIVEVGFGALVSVMAWVPYRRAEKWAWYAMWVVPGVFVGGMANSLKGEVSPSIFIALVLISLLGLLLPYRRFFPPRSAQSSPVSP